MYSDAESLKKVPKEKLKTIIEFNTRHRVQREAHTESEYVQIAADFGLSIKEFDCAIRFLDSMFLNGGSLSHGDLASDFEKLGFDTEKSTIIIDTLQQAWKTYSSYLEAARLEAIPVLSSMHWRIDIRLSSGDFLAKPDIVAYLRIGADDGTKKTELVLELDKESFSWFESVIGKIRKEMLSAESTMNKLQI
jgi:hypothetical protein